ncbi:MAG: DUF2721 domain-containing protein [Chromatiales bacterium]|jgi:hypothetical protein
MTLDQIVPVLQLSISPVIVISGIGLVLLSMSNRYSHVADRCRSLVAALHVDDEANSKLRLQLRILSRRARLLRLAIALATASLLLAALLVIALFAIALMNLQSAFLIVVLFAGCMLLLILGLMAFLLDVHLSVQALEMDMNL